MFFLIIIVLINIYHSHSQLICPTGYGDLTPDIDLTVPDSQGNYAFPQCPDVIDLQFLVFTCDSRENPQVINWDFNDNQIINSIIASNTEAKFITHGGETNFYTWGVVMKNYTLNIFCNVMGKNVNVIGVNWPNGAAVFSQAWGAASYFNEAANIKVVAALIAKLVRKLQVFRGISSNQIELIGHSWGTIASAQAGRLITPKVDRITGMEPSSLGFQGPDKQLKLDSSDAIWTNCIHTNGINPGTIVTEGGIGIAGNYEALSSIDFYINGGSQQPGCPPAPDFCSHNRVTDLVDVFVPNNCQFIAYKADSYLLNFLTGNFDDCETIATNCRPLPLAFDYWENPINKNTNGLPFPNKYYLQTSGGWPFCQFHYQIKLTKTSGTCALIALDFNGGGTVPNFTGAGNVCTALFVSDNDITPLNSVNIRTFGFSSATVTRVDVLYLSHIDKIYRASRTAKFCPKDPVPVNFLMAYNSPIGQFPPTISRRCL